MMLITEYKQFMVRKSINLQIVQGKIQRSFSLIPSSRITNGQLFINNESNLHSVQRVIPQQRITTLAFCPPDRNHFHLSKLVPYNLGSCKVAQRDAGSIASDN